MKTPLIQLGIFAVSLVTLVIVVWAISAAWKKGQQNTISL